MKANRINTIKEFYDLTVEKLLSDEVRYSLLFGLAERAVSNNAPEQKGTWYLTITDKDKLCIAVWRTPLQPILAYFEGDINECAKTLADAVHSIEPSIPGIVGDKNIADAFTKCWCESFGNKITDRMSQRIYKLTDLIMPKLSPGVFRKATLFEKDTVILWNEAFYREALNDVAPPDIEKICLERIRNGNIFIWVDNIPKSMAIKTIPGKNGISISGVYTPPENRSIGFASSCVSSLCKLLLTEYSYCTYIRIYPIPLQIRSINAWDSKNIVTQFNTGMQSFPL